MPQMCVNISELISAPQTLNLSFLICCVYFREFVSCVRSIKILSPTEIQQMSQEQLEILNSVPVPPRPSSSNSEDARTQNSPVNPPTASQER